MLIQSSATSSSLSLTSSSASSSVLIGEEEGDRKASWLVAGGAIGCGCACDDGEDSADEGVDWMAGAVSKSRGLEEGESQ